MLDLKVPLVLAGIKGFDAGGSGFLGFARIRTGNGLGECLHSRPCRDEALKWMGHPGFLCWEREDRQRQRRNAGVLRCAQNDKHSSSIA